MINLHIIVPGVAFLRNQIKQDNLGYDFFGEPTIIICVVFLQITIILDRRCYFIRNVIVTETSGKKGSQAVDEFFFNS